MPVGRVREKVLYGIGRRRGKLHRYTKVRWIVAITATVAVSLLPLLGIFRFDFWSGRHTVLGDEVTVTEAAKAFAWPFLAVNIVIIIASRTIGRYLCGFVCPYGALTRLREWFRFRSKEPLPRLVGEVLMFGACVLLSAVVFTFWLRWEVFLEGSTLARSLSLAFLFSMIGGLYFLVRFLGIGFCRGWCPSGVYFALLGPDTLNGVEFAHEENCTECGACEKVCPVDLQPRDMSGGAHRGGIGFYVDGMSNFSNCLRCGDCINACEGMTDRYQKSTPLRMGWLPEGARDSRETTVETPSAEPREPTALAARETPEEGEHVA